MAAAQRQRAPICAKLTPMDDIVKKAMAKWPNVPHCYGWLALDARGAWRMRDERAQHLNLAGDKVTQTALLGFINRNYAVDERGCWYFQNGPQRVFLNLEATPFIARTDPQHGLVLQTGEPVDTLSQVLLTDQGEFIVVAGDGERPGGVQKVAQVDDRDAVQLMAWLRINDAPVSDEQLMAWLDNGAGALTLTYRDQRVAVERIAAADVARQFKFERMPQAAPAEAVTS